MKAKSILVLTVAVVLTGTIGTIDLNTFNGNHSVTGYVVNGKVIADNGNTYSASDFKSEGKVKVTLDKTGTVISMKEI